MLVCEWEDITKGHPVVDTSMAEADTLRKQEVLCYSVLLMQKAKELIRGYIMSICD